MNIIVLNLERAIERKEKMIAQFQKLGIKDYIFYPAVDGKNITNVSIIGNIAPGHIGHPRQFKPGEIGCALSHIGAVSMAKCLNYEYTLILEDDVIFCEDFISRMERLMKMLPKNWEHVLLGAHIYNTPAPIIQPCLLPVNFRVSGAYSYLLRNTVYDNVIKTLTSLETTADDIYEELIRDGLKSFIFFPLLTYPNVEDSYIWETSGNKVKHGSYKNFKNKL